MSQDTSTPEVETSTTAESAEDKVIHITVRGQTIKCVLDSSKRRNSDERIYKIRPVIDPSEAIAFVADVLSDGGVRPEVALARIHARVYQELVRGYAAEAMEGTFVSSVDPETGEPTTGFDQEKWIKNFTSLFEEGSRRASGPSKKELEDTARNLGERLSQLLQIGSDGNPVMPAIGSPEFLELARVTSELTEINKKIHAKEGARANAKPRKPRKPKAVAAPAAVASN